MNTVKRELEFSLSRTCEIIIIGLTAKLLSDKDILNKIAIKLNIPFEPWHVSLTRSIKSRINSNVYLIVRFISPVFRTSWLKAKRFKGVVKCSDIESDQPAHQIYINERQTANERQALFEAKKECESLGYHGGWMSNGKILFKKSPEGRVFVYKPKPPSTRDDDMEFQSSNIANTTPQSNTPYSQPLNNSPESIPLTNPSDHGTTNV